MRGLTQLHEDPHLIKWAQTPGGKLAVWVIAAGLLLPSYFSILFVLFLGLVMIWPEQRQTIVLLATPLVALELFAGPINRLVTYPDALNIVWTVFPAVLTALTIVLLCIMAARNYEVLPRIVQAHPVLTLHLFTLCAIIGYRIAFLGAPDSAWKVLILGTLPFLVWRCCYIMLSGQRGSAKTSAVTDHLFYALPVFGGSNVPFGKGYDYLKRCRATDPEALARSQLAGLKLLTLYWLWIAVRKLIRAITYGDYHGWPGFAEAYGIAGSVNLGIPHLSALVTMSNPASPHIAYAWASLMVALIVATLSIAIIGHIIIGALRLLGFNVFRNTYKPLLSETIIDFWNRFYYYFKELLVEFFFYPVYTRYFRSYQRLRIFAAVFAAACLGNIYYHLLRDSWQLHALTLEEIFSRTGSRSFYTVLLAFGVFFSMIAQSRKRGCELAVYQRIPEWAHRIRRIAGVWLFFSLIHIWNIHSPDANFSTRSAFFFSLFGIDIGY